MGGMALFQSYFNFSNLLFFVFFLSISFGSTISQADTVKASCYLSHKDQLRLEELSSLNIDAESFLKSSPDCSHSFLSQFLDVISQIKKIEFDSQHLKSSNDIIQALLKPYEYLASRDVKSFKFEASGRAVAVFDINTHEILVSQFFFEQSYVNQLSTLLHESHHADVSSPWHEVCQQGHLKGVSGACDLAIESELRLAGAYSIDYWFLKMISEDKTGQFSTIDKLEAHASFYELFSHRFNHTLMHGQTNDSVFVLTESNQLQLYNPVLNQMVPVFKELWGRVRKIKFNEYNNGVYILTKKNYLLLVSPYDLSWNFVNYPGIKPFQGRIKDIHRPISPDNDVRRNLIQTVDDQFYLQSVGKDLKTTFLLRDDMKYKENLVLNHGYQIRLQNDGSYSILDNRYQDYKFEVQDFNKQIKNLIPAHKALSFYAVDQDDVLHFVRFERPTLSNMFGVSEPTLKFFIDEFQAPKGHKLVKMQEGIGMRGLLDDHGHLHLAKHQRHIKIAVSQKAPTQRTLKSSDKITDFVIFKRAFFNKAAHKVSDKKAIMQLQSACSIQADSIQIEPWTGKALGINAMNDLVIYSANTCKVLEKSIVSFAIQPRRLSLNPFGYQVSELVIEKEDGVSLTKSYFQ